VRCLLQVRLGGTALTSEEEAGGGVAHAFSSSVVNAALDALDVVESAGGEDECSDPHMKELQARCVPLQGVPQRSRCLRVWVLAPPKPTACGSASPCS
jgi:hypothetical protein